MRFIVALALAMFFAAPATNADASSYMSGGMAFSQSIDCHTSDCCRLDMKSYQSGSHANHDSNQCGSQFNCGSCASFSGEIVAKEKLPLDSIARIAPDYSRLLTSSHLVALERPPQLLS